MKKLSFFLVTTYPYFILLALALLLSSTSRIMETVFRNNAFLLIGAVALFSFAVFSWTVVFAALNFCKQSLQTQAWAKAVMIVKLFQIPAYLLFFVLGILFLLTFFMIPFTFALVAIDLLCITMTGLLGTITCRYAQKEQTISPQKAILLTVLQFVFCVDVVASVILYIKCKKSN